MHSPNHDAAEESQRVPLLSDSNQESAGLGALNYLSRAAHESFNVPTSPTNLLNRSESGRQTSPIKRIPVAATEYDISSDHPSDAEANLVVIENPDGSLVEGMPTGFKHSTPVASPPRTPRALNFGITGLDLVDLFKRHERIFLGLLISTILIDAIVLSEEFTTVIGGIMSFTGSVTWGTRLGSILPNIDKEFGAASQVSNTMTDSQIRHTFSVFPPHWQLGWSLLIASVDSLVCLAFFVVGFIACVSKQRKAYAWFGTVSCGALIWQVVLSCVDKLSLVLFLFRLASFTHARFMGDLMDDITLLATLMNGRQVISQVEQLSARASNDVVRIQ